MLYAAIAVAIGLAIVGILMYRAPEDIDGRYSGARSERRDNE